VVRELLDETQNPGWHEVHWDGRDQAGRHVSSGVYFYRLEGTGPLLIRSMTLLK
jgi:flagellar hook assembly protein FlgD